MFRKQFNLWVATCCTCLWISGACGFVQNYGDFDGATVMYLDVTESNPGVSALFGAPSIMHDVLEFSPQDFAAIRMGLGSGSVVVDSQLNLTIMSSDLGLPITNVIFEEIGDYTLQGIGTALAQASVGMAVFVNVTEVNGLPLFVSGGQYTMVFSPASSFSLPADLGAAVPWTGQLDVDVTAIAAGATKVEVVLDNTLTAAHANGGSASIAKSSLRILTLTVPEPGYFGWASLLGMTALAMHQRTKAYRRRYIRSSISKSQQW